jgi:hypothetical protein
MRVHSWVPPSASQSASHLDETGAGVLLLVRRDGVLEVAEQHVDLRRDVGDLADHLRVRRVEEVDHPRGEGGDLAHGLGGAEGEGLEEVLRAAHAGVLRRGGRSVGVQR